MRKTWGWNKMRNKKDLIILIILPILAVILSLVFKTNFLISTLLFFGLPSLYLSFKNKKSIKKTFVISVLTAIPFSIILEYFAEKGGTWFVNSVFSYRIFGLITIDGIIWFFLMTYFIIIFYEYFFDKKDNGKINKKISILEVFLVSLLIIMFVIHLFFNEFILSYFYLIMGLLLVSSPILLYLRIRPNFIPRYIKIVFYFTPIFLLYEITALQLNQWSFPGKNFIGWVNLFGYSFPFEEFIFWIALSSISIISYYEYFADDRK